MHIKTCNKALYRRGKLNKLIKKKNENYSLLKRRDSMLNLVSRRHRPKHIMITLKPYILNFLKHPMINTLPLLIKIITSTTRRWRKSPGNRSRTLVPRKRRRRVAGSDQKGGLSSGFARRRWCFGGFWRRACRGVWKWFSCNTGGSCSPVNCSQRGSICSCKWSPHVLCLYVPWFFADIAGVSDKIS